MRKPENKAEFMPDSETGGGFGGERKDLEKRGEVEAPKGEKPTEKPGVTEDDGA